MAQGALGRKRPLDLKHVDKWPLTAAHIEEIAEPRPMAVGIDWFPEFDEPYWDAGARAWYVRAPSPRSRPRGGHAIALKPRGVNDLGSWYDFYNQVSEGICVSEAVARMQSLNNRRAYQPRWLYDQCKKIDGAPNEEGTWVSVAFDVTRKQGLVRRKPGEPHALHQGEITRYPDAREGISANRWATSIDDVLNVLGYADKDYVDGLNSWGRLSPDGREGYPHLVRFPAEVMEFLRNRDAEFGIVTDR
jgi:hypothetical protein